MYYELIKTTCRACNREYETHPLANAYGPYGSMCHECRCAKQTLEQLNEVETAPPIVAAAAKQPLRQRIREAWSVLLGRKIAP